MTTRKLIIVSNRLPVNLRKSESGWELGPSSGGLVTALAGIEGALEFQWVGWVGADVPDHELDAVKKIYAEGAQYQPVFLAASQIDHFYNGFCNSVVWPLFHYLPSLVDFSLPYWDEYKRVNEQFCEAILPLCDDDTMVWVHDYHLFLLPQLLRKAKPNLRIGFFLHIPFPSSEIYRLLPVREELLRGMLGSDLIGFQTHEYSRHFASTSLRVLGVEATVNEVQYEGRRVSFGSYPVGINPANFVDTLKTPEIEPHRAQLQKTYAKRKIILGVDRLDYSKGLPHKLEAFQLFLEQYPQWRGKAVLVQVAIPSRTHVPEYQRLKSHVDQLVGQINGRFGNAEYMPIHYIAHEVNRHELCALYEAADVCLVTSIRDGMNLVSFEYAACQKERCGVLILSEFCGAAHSLGSAFFINPWDPADVAKALDAALNLEEGKRKVRALHNFNYVKDFSSINWARRLLRDLESGEGTEINLATDLRTSYLALKRQFLDSRFRILLLDYDGTLTPFRGDPAKNEPSSTLVEILNRLGSNRKNRVYLMSGRRQEELNRWFGQLPIGLAAEHGMFVRDIESNDWQQAQETSGDWIEMVRNILDDYTKRTPGSLIEQKAASIAWHYREADGRFGEWQSHELMIHLEQTLANLPVAVVQGHRLVEVRPQGVNKGSFARSTLNGLAKDQQATVLCFGDDRTDEEMFLALPPKAWSCRVGNRRTMARYYLHNPDEVLEILSDLSALA